MKYALNLEPEALDDYSELDEFEDEETDSFQELDENTEHECESCAKFNPKYDGSEWEAEVMRGRRVPQRSLRTRPVRTPRVRTPRVRTRPGMRRPRFRPRVIRRPVQVIGGPSVCNCPAPNCPQHGSEYVRWVQSALNQIMNLQLPVSGFMNPATRSALRSFQEKQGLPIDGIAGPETRDALIAARGGKSPGAGVRQSAEPAMSGPAEPATTSPAAEFDFEWENSNNDETMRYFTEYEFEGEAVGRASTTPQRSTFALARVIPDDPNFQKYVPINYRLNAKKIVGETAHDLSKGLRIHHGVEIVHVLFTAAEIIAEATVVAGLLLGGIALAAAAVGNFLALGAPYLEAAKKISANWASSGFSRGVVMDADKRQAQLVKNYFGNDYFPPNSAFPRSRSIAIANYKMGLLVGYVNGRALSQNQRRIFWRDLSHRMGDQSYRGSQKQWTRREWIDSYVTAAAIFRRDHLT
ncbi:hypothetical protein METHB2_530027 [Candidatus Methylobacter favarea]|uniref:Peptidoglycan binding-like domain-containing protein n=1 Tax=Candidatus Methylobacter favarea TaxID=2707345 RepID=A0A8S0XKB3_9GAMM|nr:peptidoglycan-binding domain-containing protein [Candidatus Methylobacter favarea]CAA9891952.1 hypothetical protein METHB2_530027 [Candidatus Methylobacter favarea]